MLVDEFMPVYDISDSVAIVVHADTAATWDALMEVGGEMRVATTDAHARRWFRRYWTFGVGSGAHVLVNGVIEMARDEAEASG